MEEKAGRKERKKEVVEVMDGDSGQKMIPFAPTSFLPRSYLPGGVGVLPFS